MQSQMQTKAQKEPNCPRCKLQAKNQTRTFTAPHGGVIVKAKLLYCICLHCGLKFYTPQQEEINLLAMSYSKQLIL